MTQTTQTVSQTVRWHPQLSGASFFGSDFIGDVLRELDRDLGVDVSGWSLYFPISRCFNPQHKSEVLAISVASFRLFRIL